MRKLHRLSLATLCALLVPLVATGGAAASRRAIAVVPKPPASVALEECTSAATQMERSATFAAEMTLLPGSTRMEMRIQLLERTPKARSYRAVTAPGLGTWRMAAAGVKVYRYVKQVTNLAAPASYRAEVRFRWLSAHGKVIRAAERRSTACAQLLPSETGAIEAAPVAEKPSAAVTG